MEENKSNQKEDIDKMKLIKEFISKMGFEFSKENFVGEKTENYEEIQNNIYKGYLKDFDKEMETNTQQTIKEIPLLRNLFIEFSNSTYKPSEIYQISLKTRNKIDKELKETLNEEQKFLLKQLLFCKDTMEDEMIQKSFVYGYAMASQLREETLKLYPYKKKE